MNPITISIIGTAGRKEDAAKLTYDHWRYMFNDSIKRINAIKDEVLEQSEYRTQHDLKVELVSGGAAWADHLAVELYIAYYVDALTLHLPCPFDLDKGIFTDNNSDDWRENPGKTANYYHRKFSKVVGFSSLENLHSMYNMEEKGKGLSDVKYKEIKRTVSNGFFERNSKVAQSQHLIAYTFGKGDTPKDGGTLDTWNKCKGRKVHVSLEDLL